MYDKLQWLKHVDILILKQFVCWKLSEKLNYYYKKKLKVIIVFLLEKKFYSMIIVFIVIRIKPLACRKKRVGDAIHMSYMLATTKPRYLCFPQLVYWRELVSGFVQVRDVKLRLTK